MTQLLPNVLHITDETTQRCIKLGGLWKRIARESVDLQLRAAKDGQGDDSPCSRGRPADCSHVPRHVRQAIRYNTDHPTSRKNHSLGVPTRRKDTDRCVYLLNY